MRRTLGLGLVVLAAALASGCGGGGGITALPQGQWIRADGSLSPTVHLFGDTIEAEVHAVVDAERLDPDRLSLKTFFAPYEQVGPTEVSRRDAGGLAEVRYRLRLRCLERACMTATLGTTINPGGGAPRSFRFPPAQLRYADPDAEQPRLLRIVRFGSLESVSRINAQDVTQVYGFPFRGSFTPLPAASERVSPATLATVLLAAAVLLLVLPAALVARWARRRRQPPPAEPEPEQSPLAQALALVEWSLGREDGAERRAALDALAGRLDAVDADGLASETRVAAWSPPMPSVDGTRRILEAVKERYGDA